MQVYLHPTALVGRLMNSTLREADGGGPEKQIRYFGTVTPNQIEAVWRHERGEPCNQIHRLEDRVAGAVAPAAFETI